MSRFNNKTMPIEKSIKKNYDLTALTTFKIGGPARYFFEAKSVEDLTLALHTVTEHKIPYFSIEKLCHYTKIYK